MIPLVCKDKPPQFDTDVRDKGNDWLADHPTAAASIFPDYWNDFREEIEAAFDGRCAYLGLFVTSGQVDHFVSKKADRSKAYEWDNYRWAEPRVNGLKGKKPFLDPFAIQEGWIAVDPNTLEYILTDLVPAALAAAAENTLAVLNDGELLRGRRRVLNVCLQQDGNWDVGKLRVVFPLLAKAVETLL